jgi:protein NrfD
MNKPLSGDASTRTSDALQPFQEWDGSTYYGRQQLKPWPFEPLVVGGYIFLAGLSGSSQILATIADATGRPELEGAARRGRYLSLLAPTIGAALLIYDLHTPKRFYNMLRVAKATSPMSIGTWVLMSFSACAFAAAAGQAGADRWPKQAWMRGVAKTAGVPAALAGAGLSTYTAALLSATSTPIWAAAPASLAVRFGASSIAAGAAALALGEKDPAVRGKLDAVQATALALEVLLAAMAQRRYRREGVHGAFDSIAGKVERIGATGLGVALPLALLAGLSLMGRRPRALSAAAGIATLMGSATLRVAMLSLGNVSAKRPEVSFRFSTPANLPDQQG